jgi:hypothetical protein
VIRRLQSLAALSATVGVRAGYMSCRLHAGLIRRPSPRWNPNKGARRAFTSAAGPEFLRSTIPMHDAELACDALPASTF